MKNELTVVLDTEAEHTIMIGKTPEFAASTDAEAAADVIKDIATLCEAVVVLIRVAHSNGIKDEAACLRDCIHHLEQGFIDPYIEGYSAVLGNGGKEIPTG